MIAWNEDEFRAAAHLVKEGLHDAAMGLRPDPAALDAPEIDDIADEVDRSCLIVAQKSQERGGPAAAGCKMYVREEQGSVQHYGLLVQRGIDGPNLPSASTFTKIRCVLQECDERRTTGPLCGKRLAIGSQ